MSYVDEHEYDDDDDELEEEEEDEELEEEEEEEVQVKPTKAAKAAAAGGKKRGKGKNKDPYKPKRNQSAFFLYSNEHRARVKSENPGIAFGDVAKILSEEFKLLPQKERAKWDAKAEKDKQRYEKEMTGYVPPPSTDDGKRKKAKKDPLKPKRNQSAFFIYSNAVRNEVKAQYPQASFGDVAKIISEQFKSLPAASRAKWDNLAEKDKVRYQREMASYQG